MNFQRNILYDYYIRNMNACEKKELKNVLQKLSDKLEGKMVGGGKTIEITVRKNAFFMGPNGITFSFPYPISGNKNKYITCNIQPSLPGYADLYNDTITNITFSNNTQTIVIDRESSTYYEDLVNNRYTIDLTITSTNKSKTYSNMSGLRIDPIHDFGNMGYVGYCAPETGCYPSIYPNSCAMTLIWDSYEPKCFPDGITVSINL